MTSQRITTRPPRRPISAPRPPVPTRPLRRVLSARPRRPLIYWRPVALAAAAGALFVACVMVGIVLLPARSVGPRQVARAEPPAPAAPEHPARPLLLPADPPPPPAPKAAAPPRPAAPACETFGTSVHFAVSPAAAEKQAAQEGKLLFLLHVSGDFEDDTFT